MRTIHTLPQGRYTLTETRTERPIYHGPTKVPQPAYYYAEAVWEDASGWLACYINEREAFFLIRGPVQPEGGPCLTAHATREEALAALHDLMAQLDPRDYPRERDGDPWGDDDWDAPAEGDDAEA